MQIATDAIDRLHTTAESHDRVMVVEVMGRHAGWIATYAGIAGGADAILVPEWPFDIDEVVRAPAPPPRARAQLLDRRRRRGRDAAEGDAGATAGETDAFGHARLGRRSACRSSSEIEERTGFETRVTILGHVQRGGTPTAFDRVLATRFGVAAMDAVARRALRRDGRRCAAPRSSRSRSREALREPKLLDPALYRDRRALLRLTLARRGPQSRGPGARSERPVTPHPRTRRAISDARAAMPRLALAAERGERRAARTRASTIGF